MEIYGYGDSGAPICLEGNALCATLACSGQMLQFKTGDTGRHIFVDENGRLCISLPEDQIARFEEDVFDDELDGENNEFTLSRIPKCVSLFWNGILMRQDKDFVLIANKIITYFKPYSNNRLVAKYMY